MTHVKVTGSRGPSELHGTQGLFKASDEIKLRRFNEGVELADIRAAIRDNNLDEVVFVADSGDRYVLYADELQGRVQPGDRIEADGLRGMVELVDNEWNEARVVMGSCIVGGVLFAAASTAFVGYIFTGAGSGVLAALADVGTSASTLGPVAVATGIGAAAANLAGAFQENDAGIRLISREVLPRSKKV